MTPTHVTESERRTRKSRIDPKLKAWGWEIVPFDPARPLSKYSRHAIEEYPTANGPADYALVVDGQLLGVVEAKKVTLGPQNVLTKPSATRRAWTEVHSTSTDTRCRSCTLRPQAITPNGS